jgi:hypothetical protein
MQEARPILKSEPRGIVLTLICIVVFLLLAKLIFPPIASDAGQAVWWTGL